MTFLDWFKSKYDKQLEEIRLEHERERLLDRREYEKKKQDIEISIKEKKKQLDEAILNYKIADEESKLNEDFGEDIDEENHEENADDKVIKLINNVTDRLATQPQPAGDSFATATPHTPVGVEVTDEQIKILWDNMSKIERKIAKASSDSQITDFIKARQPNMTDSSIKRIILFINRA
jgi:hypothetical protein